MSAELQAARPAAALAGVSQTTKCPVSRTRPGMPSCALKDFQAGRAFASNERSAVRPWSTRFAAFAMRTANGSQRLICEGGRPSAPPLLNNLRGAERMTGQEASGSTCSVAMCPAFPHDAAPAAGTASITVASTPTRCRPVATLSPTTPPPIITARCIDPQITLAKVR
jgi:hypothetical protein